MSKLVDLLKPMTVGTNVEVSPVEKSKTEQNVVLCKVDEKLYAENLPETLTMDIVNEVNNYNKNYIGNITRDSAAAAAKIFENDKTVDAVKFTAPYLGETITTKSSRLDVTIEKAKTSRIPGAEVKYVTRPAVSIDVINKFEVEKSFLKDLSIKLQEQLAAN